MQYLRAWLVLRVLSHDAPQSALLIFEVEVVSGSLSRLIQKITVGDIWRDGYQSDGTKAEQTAPSPGLCP